MTKTWALGSVLVLALVGGGWLFGQDETKEQPKVKGTLPANWNKLGLTDEQKQKVYSVRAEYGTKIAELRAEIQKLQKKEQEEMQKVLTDAQKARLREILTEKAPGAATEKKPESKESKK